MKATTQLFALLALLLSSPAIAQHGTIVGTVIDAENEMELIGANVFILGSTIGSSADLDGNFEIGNVPTGNVKVVCSFVSYQNDTIDITVNENTKTTLNFVLGTKAQTIAQFTVEARQNKGGDSYMMQQMEKSDAVVTGISADQIARGGDGSAAGAVKRAGGITVEGGKYVYVRGLSDRYSKTTLNGAQVPGLDPNRNSVQMDLFPTNLIENLTITKSFTPNLPGSFTGGLINIETKDFPDAFTFNLSTSMSYNARANMNSEFLTYDGGSTDGLGFDDGTRDIPSTMPNEIPTRFEMSNNNWASDLTDVNQSFNTTYDVKQKTPGLNRAFAVDFGNRLNIGGDDKGRKLGFIGGITYSQSYESYTNGVSGRYKLTGADESIDFLNTEELLQDSKSSESILWGALFNTSMQLNDNNTVRFVAMHNQNGVSTARFLEGNIPSDAQDIYKQTRQLLYQERALSTAQVQGEHTLSGERGIEIDWSTTYTLSKQNTPDLRFFSNDYTINPVAETDTMYSIQTALYVPSSRYFRDLEETNLDAQLDFSWPLAVNKKDGAIKLGLANLIKDRIATERRFDLKNNGIDFDGDLDTYLAAENFDIDPFQNYLYYEGYGGTTGNDRTNSYIGAENVAAAYAMVDVYATPLLRVIAGARAEKTIATSQSLNPNKPTGELDNLDILPSLNLTYQIAEKAKLRAAATRTLARPTFRELAPFASYDFELRTTILGNSELERTTVTNLDLRWELYPNRGEMISFGAFYKQFTNPIERVFSPTAGNQELQYRNVSEGTVYGAEFEIKKGLAYLSDKLEGLSVGGNATYVFSKVAIDPAELEAIRAVVPDHLDSRTMFGQSPYIINAFVGFKHDPKGLSTNLNFNISGQKMVVVGVKGTPDVFEQARPSLDWNITKDLGQRLTLKVSARNLLNSQSLFTQTFKGTDYDYQSYRIGRTYGISLKYSLAKQ